MNLLCAFSLIFGAWSAPAAPRVVAALREPVTTLSPFAPATIEGYRLTGLIFEPLARVNPRTQALEPWLAKSWRRFPGALRVELRAGVHFHDGRDVSAEDVRQTLLTFRDPANKAATWLPLWADFTAVRVVSPRVIEFKTQKLTHESLRNLLTTLRVLPAHRPAQDLVGTGPFKYKSLSGTRVEFEPNPRWWGTAKPNFDLSFRTVADAGAARDLIQTGQLDVFRLGTTEDQGAVQAGAGEGLWLDLNLRRELFRPRAVRRALLMAWDRAQLNQKLFAGQRRVALDTFDPNGPAYPPGVPVKFDPAAARSALKALGWTEREGHLERAGQRFEFEVLVSSSEDERWVSLWQRSLNEVGIVINIKRLAMDGEWWRRLQRGDFDAAAGSGGLAPAVNADAWRTGGAYNSTGLSDAALDRTLDHLNVEFEEVRRHKLTREAIGLVRDALAQLPGVIRAHAGYLVSPRVKIDPAAPDEPWLWRVDAR